MEPRLPEMGNVFELRIRLRAIEPEIWRRLLVPAEVPLGVLNEVIQVAFGWQNSHLHDLLVGNIRFRMADVEDEIFSVDEFAAPLGAVANVGSTFLSTTRLLRRIALEPRQGRRSSRRARYCLM